jgi:putative acetyltransferase
MIEIITVSDALGLDSIRALFTDYAQSLGFELDFQDFAGELANLPGEYAPPQGRLLLARVDGKPGGCVALRPLAPGICEMKRLYVRPEFRGKGIGRMLVEWVIAEARQIGYHKMRLDTVPGMEEAIGLYRRFGFREIAPYRFNPIPGALYFELDLGQ